MASLGIFFSVFFFFQAEDGIRDGTVTGVQTCALPISWELCRRTSPCHLWWLQYWDQWEWLPELLSAPGHCWFPYSLSCCRRRSEERRVGKECRSRWSTKH